MSVIDQPGSLDLPISDRPSEGTLSGGSTTSTLAEVTHKRRSRLAAFRQRNLFVGGAIVLIIVLVAIFAPLIAPRGPQETDYGARLISPSRAHLLGTDNLGKDMLSRVI